MSVFCKDFCANKKMRANAMAAIYLSIVRNAYCIEQRDVFITGNCYGNCVTWQFVAEWEKLIRPFNLMVQNSLFYLDWYVGPKRCVVAKVSCKLDFSWEIVEQLVKW